MLGLDPGLCECVEQGRRTIRLGPAQFAEDDPGEAAMLGDDAGCADGGGNLRHAAEDAVLTITRGEGRFGVDTVLQ